MNQDIATKQARDFAVSLRLPIRFSRVYRGSEWWVFVIDDDNPNYPFLVIGDDCGWHTENIPVGPTFDNLTEASLTASGVTQSWELIEDFGGKGSGRYPKGSTGNPRWAPSVQAGVDDSYFDGLRGADNDSSWYSEVQGEEGERDRVESDLIGAGYQQEDMLLRHTMGEVDTLRALQENPPGSEISSMAAALDYRADAGRVNALLRGTSLEDASGTDETADAVINALETPHESIVYTMPTDTVMYRGLSRRNAGTPHFTDTMKTGDYISDRGFVSMAADKSKAEVFARSPDGNGVVVRIIVPEGTRALKGSPYETELFTSPGSMFKVLGRTDSTMDLEMMAA